MTTSTKRIILTLLVTSAWAIVFIASAKLLKGNPAKDLVQAVLYGLGFILMFLPATMRSKSQCC